MPSLQKLTVLPREKHWQAWETLVLESQTRPTPRGKFTDTLRLEKKALELGRTVGALERLDALSDNGTHHPFGKAIPLLTRRELSDEQIAKLEKIINEGYHEGLSGKDL